MFKFHPLIALDFYKTSHPPQYPEGTETVFANFTARSNKHFTWQQAGDGYVVFFGLSGLIQEFLVEGWNERFFNLPAKKAVSLFKHIMKSCVDPDYDDSKILELHKVGHLPLQIRALPEGTRVPIGVPMFTVINTDDRFAWLTNKLETLLSTELWGRITIATIAYEYKNICSAYSQTTCDTNDHLPFQCHDFSMRGVMGYHTSGAVSAGHLLSFAGTDSVPSIAYLMQYYKALATCGGSIPATEHSVMCAGGKGDEEATIKRLLTEVYPSGIFSAVLDTWDFFKVLTEMLPRLAKIIKNRDGKFVVRPDSGDPVDIICGDPKALKDSPESKGAIQLLWETFGGHVNHKGYKVLDECIGLIYGDSITLERAEEIFKRLEAKGFASSNVVLGVGSYTYQMVTRDTFGMAMKSTAVKINGEWKEIFKDPATDDGTKKSAKGLLQVREVDGKLTVVDGISPDELDSGLLETVYLNGEHNVQPSLSEIINTLYK